MAGRTTLLTTTGTRGLLDWIARRENNERFELAAQAAVENPTSSPNSLTREGVSMYWVGSAAEEMGLSGEASPASAARVLVHGIGPQGQQLRTAVPAPTSDGEQLERRHTVGMVLSAPKTISLLLAHPDAEVREAVTAALDTATHAAIAELEQEVTVRRGRGGTHSEPIQGVVGVAALHYTSSAGDPHAHAHIVLNASAPAESDGKWRALDSRVLFAAQKIAESAFHRTLQEELTRRLELSPHDWEPRWVGSVQVHELKALTPLTERYSQATAHMQSIAKQLGTRLGIETYHEHGLIWARHRAEKGELAEQLEHKLDAMLARGGTDADAIRAVWTERLGDEQDRLLRIRARSEPLAVAELERPSRPVGWADPARDQELAEAIAAEKAAMHEKRTLAAQLHGASSYLEYVTERLAEHHAQKPTWQFWRQQEWQRELAFLEAEQAKARAEVEARNWLLAEIRQREEKLAPLEAEQKQRQSAQEQSREILRQLTDQVGVIVPTDVVAYARSTGLDRESARQYAADCLEHWTREGLIQWPEGRDPAAIINAVRNGHDPDTRIQQWANSHTGKVVPTQLLIEEQTIHEQARNLAQAQRQQLAIDTSGLTPDQAQAVSLIGEGRGLTAIQGVAGAGKSHMLRPVVDAAYQQNMDVIVLARNAKLAQELGQELNAEAMTLAKWQHTPPRIERPTMLIVDESGLVDRRDWQAVMHAAENDSRIQIVAVGDRRQAQAIDRRATWAVITDATQQAGGFAELTKTFRNASWAEEATQLRNGDPTAADRAAAEGRIVTASTTPWMAPGWSGAQRAAEVVLTRMRQGEDALAVAATNAEAAAIASAVQRGLGIQTDPRTCLRWDQQTGVGDRVRTRKNEYAARIRNGDTWTVQSIDADHIVIRANDGRAAYVPHVWAREHLELAYAATVDSAQGVTVDRAVVLVGDGMGVSRVYSAATRGRQSPIYVVETESPTAARDAVAAAIMRDDIQLTMREHLAGDRDRSAPRAPPGRELEL